MSYRYVVIAYENADRKRPRVRYVTADNPEAAIAIAFPPSYTNYQIEDGSMAHVFQVEGRAEAYRMGLSWHAQFDEVRFQ